MIELKAIDEILRLIQLNIKELDFRDRGQKIYTRSTNLYQSTLRTIVERWIDEMITFEDDEDIISALIELQNKLISLGESQIRGAFIIGKTSNDLSLADENKIREIIERNNNYIVGSFIADARQIALRVRGQSEEDIESELEKFLPRIESYSGVYWSTIWEGVGSRVLETRQQTQQIMKVERHLDVNARHCFSCPPKIGEYESWQDMLRVCGGLPGDGSDDCRGGCRCWLTVG